MNAPYLLLRCEFALAPDRWGRATHTAQRRFRLRLYDPDGALVKSIFWKRRRGKVGRWPLGTFADDGCYSPDGAYRAVCVFLVDNPEYDVDTSTIPGGDLHAAIVAITERFTQRGPRGMELKHLLASGSNVIVVDQEEGQGGQISPPPAPQRGTT